LQLKALPMGCRPRSSAAGVRCRHGRLPSFGLPRRRCPALL